MKVSAGRPRQAGVRRPPAAESNGAGERSASAVCWQEEKVASEASQAALNLAPSGRETARAASPLNLLLGVEQFRQRALERVRGTGDRLRQGRVRVDGQADVRCIAAGLDGQ